MKLQYDQAGTVTLTCVAASVTVPPPAAGTALVRVNEIQTGTAVSAADEFVELANGGSVAAEIGGWKVVYRSAAGTSDTTLGTVPAGTSLPAGGFYLFVGGGYAGAATPDQAFAVGLAAGGGAVGVRDSAGALIDSVGWGSATNALVEGSPAAAPPATSSPGSSLVRLPDGHDTNDNATDFTTASAATPRATNA